MTQQPPPAKGMPANPSLMELKAIRQELALLRRDWQTQQKTPPIADKPPEPEKVPLGAAIFKVVLGIAGILSFLYCNSAGSKLVNLRSELGTTVAEVYYQEMGTFLIGLSFFLGLTLFYFAYSVPPVGFELTRLKAIGKASKPAKRP